MTELNEDKAPPALFEHCQKVYAAMLREAKPLDVIGEDKAEVRRDGDSVEIVADRKRIMVYEGFLTQLITGKLNLSVPYYTSTRQNLIRMGCIRQLRRGGSTTPSQWELVYEPTLEAFMKNRGNKPVAGNSRLSALEARVDTLTNDYQALHDTMQEVLDNLKALLGTEPA